jgi:hypothetical protein
MIKTSILLTMSILFNNGNEEGDFAMFWILTEEQAADCLTKALYPHQLVNARCMG